MNLPYLMICCLIWSAPSLSAQTSSCSLTRKSLHQEIPYAEQQINPNTSFVDHSDGITDPRPWRSSRVSHKHRHLKTVHGTVNIIGWGVLMPIGIITARYLRKLSDDWYSLHVLSNLSGFLLGTLGWGLGISIKNAAKEHSMSTHGILGTIIFAFATLQPDEEHMWRRYWVIYHNAVGYALIVLVIANIFEGINNQNAAKGWEWVYGAILGVLGSITLGLEVLRWTVN